MQDIKTGKLLEAFYLRLRGPREGIEEVIREEPYRYYTVGIIDTALRKPEYKKGDEEIPDEKEISSSEEREEEYTPIPEAVKPSLDPASFPSSAGLMFSFEPDSEGKFVFGVYLTYAEYKYDANKKVWARKPYGYYFLITITENKLDAEPRNEENVKIEDISENEKRVYVEGDAYLYMKLIPPASEEPGKVILSFVNTRNPDMKKDERCLYQPQIGIKIIKGQVPEKGPSKLNVSFKGLMCSVLSNKQILDLKDIYGRVSFLAPDMIRFFGEEGSPENMDYISTFIPFYIKPETVHNENYEFAVNWEDEDEILAEKFTKEAEKLIRDYGEWRQSLIRDGYLKDGSREAGLIEDTRKRMEKSLNLLKSDDKVRKAFTFALKTAALSALWGGFNPPFSLRTFQAAYILTVLHSLCEEDGNRHLCDILNVPTGAGKTEAYLILAVFYSAYRRLIHGKRGGGTAVISRYTLRMLTVQQFLRTVRTFTAAEFLRKVYYPNIFGDEPFSVGLWVGQGITPNYLKGRKIGGEYIPGMSDFLIKGTINKERVAGIVSLCPACGTPLVIPKDFTADEEVKEVYFPFRIGKSINNKLLDDIKEILVSDLENFFGRANVDIDIKRYKHKPEEGYIYMLIKAPKNADLAKELGRIWRNALNNLGTVPELFLENKKYLKKLDELEKEKESGRLTELEEELKNFENYELPYPSFRYPGYKIIDERTGVYRIFCPNPHCVLNEKDVNIEAYIVDDYLYQRPPTFLLATVDKFTQLPCKDEVLNLFGGNEYEPPGLIIQDEIHLIEGPTGSVFGLYETAIDYLCGNKVKYISSSATVKEADVVSSNAFARKAFIFPAFAETEEGKDSFFMKHPVKVSKNGNYRIYAGLCAFGKGAITPQVDAYETVLNFLFEKDIKHPIIGYYNEVKELARAVGLLKQDVRLRLGKPVVFEELSSRIRSEKISTVLRKIEGNFGRYNVILTTSIFGTGVDIPGLRLMVMRGQPKKTSDYIQATGRVGRKHNSLILVIYGNTRPRDISHFENFVPYHSSLEDFIEDPSVFPLAESISERILPALATVIYKKEFRNDETDLSVRLGRVFSKVMLDKNEHQAEGFKTDPDLLTGMCESISQKLERCITKKGHRASCLYSVDQEGVYLLTSLPDTLGRVIERTCFRNVPSSMRNTEGEIVLEIE